MEKYNLNKVVVSNISYPCSYVRKTLIIHFQKAGHVKYIEFVDNKNNLFDAIVTYAKEEDALSVLSNSTYENMDGDKLKITPPNNLLPPLSEINSTEIDIWMKLLADRYFRKYPTFICDGPYWKRYIKDFPIILQHIGHNIQILHTKHFEILNQDIVNQLFSLIWMFCPNVKRLHLTSLHWPKENNFFFQNLTLLEVRNCDFSDLKLDEINMSWDCLEHLKLENCNNIKEEWFENMVHLKTLTIDGCWPYYQSYKYTFISKNQNLQSLSLINSTILFNFDFISMLPNLEILRITVPTSMLTMKSTFLYKLLELNYLHTLSLELYDYTIDNEFLIKLREKGTLQEFELIYVRFNELTINTIASMKLQTLRLYRPFNFDKIMYKKLRQLLPLQVNLQVKLWSFFDDAVAYD